MKIEGSAHIERATYSEATRALHVGFKGGKVYAYQNVPPEKWAAFQKSESKGKFLHNEVIPHHRAWPAKWPAE